MSDLPSELAELFKETTTAPCAAVPWFKVATAIHEAAKGREGEDVFSLFKWEWMAAYFLVNDTHSAQHWGTYFGPMQVMQNEEGEWTESPSIQSVNKEVLEHWLVRARDVGHPEHRARYADLVWDLGHKVKGYKRPIEALRIAVDAYIEAVRTLTEASLHKSLEWAGRAIQLAREVADKARTAAAANCIVELAERTDQCRAWRFALGCVLGSKKGAASAEQEAAVLDGMRRHADTELEPESILPFQGDEASLDLMEYFWNSGEKAAAQELGRRYMVACIPTCKQAAAMLASDWLTDLGNLMARYELPEQAREVAVLLEERSKGIAGELAHVQHRQEVDMGPINKLIDEVLKLPLPQALASMWSLFTPRLGQVREQGKRMHSGFLMSLTGRKGVEDAGRVTNAMPSYQQDPEAYFPHDYDFHLKANAPFLALAVERLVAHFKLDADILVDALEASPLFGEHNRVFISRGLRAYLDDDHMVAVHMLVPAIEAALRHLLQGLGEPTWKTPRRGSDQERHVLLLHEVLGHEQMKKYFGEEAETYLRMLLSEPKGWNVRNNVAHGLMGENWYRPGLSDRLFHVLMGLGCAREGDGAGEDKEATEG